MSEYKDRILIKTPRKLLKVTSERDDIASSKSTHGDGLRSITIVTDKGAYVISGCSHCHAVFWRKVGKEISKI